MYTIFNKACVRNVTIFMICIRNVGCTNRVVYETSCTRRHQLKIVSSEACLTEVQPWNVKLCAPNVNNTESMIFGSHFRCKNEFSSFEVSVCDQPISTMECHIFILDRNIL